MMHALHILTPGLHSTFQDAGRIGYRAAGVPASGPLDRLSLALANALVGNRPDTAALEMLQGGPAVTVLAESTRIALTGCDSAIEVHHASGRRRRVPAGRSVRLTRGDQFRIASLGASLCGYLAIEGGIALPRVLGSSSTHARSRLGGHQGRRLQSGDLLLLRLPAVAAEGESALAAPQALQLDAPIRVIPGPQDDHFTAAALQTLLNEPYSVSLQSDRMGFRLEGPQLEHSGDYNIVSDGVVAGAIQVPGSGQPIVLMADSQTTGGYPKIATVISADLPVLGRRKPGALVRFAAVGLAEAEALRRAQAQRLQRDAATIIRAVEEAA